MDDPTDFDKDELLNVLKRAARGELTRRIVEEVAKYDAEGNVVKKTVTEREERALADAEAARWLRERTGVEDCKRQRRNCSR